MRALETPIDAGWADRMYDRIVCLGEFVCVQWSSSAPGVDAFASAAKSFAAGDAQDRIRESAADFLVALTPGRLAVLEGKRMASLARIVGEAVQ